MLKKRVSKGKRGKIRNADLREQKNSCSYLTLILAWIIYGQAKEINRVVTYLEKIGTLKSTDTVNIYAELTDHQNL